MGAGQPSNKQSRGTESAPGHHLIEWIKVLGPLLISWPLVALVIVILFQRPIARVFERFTETEGSTAEIGPIKVAMGKATGARAEVKDSSEQRPVENIDLAPLIGDIRDSGVEGATVGFSLAYAMQAEIQRKLDTKTVLSAQGIYELAKKYDEWPGESYEGTSLEGGLKAVKEVGAFLESDWPYAKKSKPAAAKPAYKISGYHQLHGVEQLIGALREGHVIATTITATQDLGSPGADGTVTIKLPMESTGLTTVALVGYDSRTASFKFANHWGTSWANAGFGIIRDTDLTRILVSAYSLDLAVD